MWHHCNATTRPLHERFALRQSRYGSGRGGHRAGPRTRVEESPESDEDETGGEDETVGRQIGGHEGWLMTPLSGRSQPTQCAYIGAGEGRLRRLRLPFEPLAADRARLALRAVVRLVADHQHRAADVAFGDGEAVSSGRATTAVGDAVRFGPDRATNGSRLRRYRAPRRRPCESGRRHVSKANARRRDIRTCTPPKRRDAGGAAPSPT